MVIDLKALFGRLNETCRWALKSSIALALSRTHYNVEIEHLLAKLIERDDGDVVAILNHWEIDRGRFAVDLTRALDRMKTGNGRTPGLSPDLVNLLKQAWLLASIQHGQGRVRSGHVLWALLDDEALARKANEASPLLQRIAPDFLKRDFEAATDRSGEGGASPPQDAVTAPRPGQSPALERSTMT